MFLRASSRFRRISRRAPGSVNRRESPLVPRDVDGLRTGRGAAAAAAWIFRGGARPTAARGRFRGDESRRRRGRDVDIPRGSRRRRGRDVDIPWERVAAPPMRTFRGGGPFPTRGAEPEIQRRLAAPPRPRRGYSVGTGRRGCDADVPRRRVAATRDADVRKRPSRAGSAGRCRRTGGRARRPWTPRPRRRSGRSGAY